MSKQKEYIRRNELCFCAMTIENAVKIPGVGKASVNLATGDHDCWSKRLAWPLKTSPKWSMGGIRRSPSWQISGRRTRRKERKERSALKRNEAKPNHFSDFFRRATSLIAMADMFGIPMPAFLSPMQSPVSYALIQLALFSQLSGLDVVSSWMDLKPYPKDIRTWTTVARHKRCVPL